MQKTRNEAIQDVIDAAEAVVGHMQNDLFLGDHRRHLSEEEASRIADALTLLLPTVLGMERSEKFAKNGVALRKAGERLTEALHSLHDTREG